jgi:hypothetical protein
MTWQINKIKKRKDYLVCLAFTASLPSHAGCEGSRETLISPQGYFVEPAALYILGAENGN